MSKRIRKNVVPRKMIHYSVLYMTRTGLAGVVQSFRSIPEADRVLDLLPRPYSRRSAPSPYSQHGANDGSLPPGLIGYVGNYSFDEAVFRAGAMERDAPDAWDPSWTKICTR